MASSSGVDLRSLLRAVEAAPPVAAADVVGEALRQMCGAQRVSFLIADFSGDALIRLGHADAPSDARRVGRETGEWVSLVDSAHGRALAGQSPQVVDAEGSVLVLAPVTSRGEAVGVLEVQLGQTPDQQTVDDIALAAHALAYIVIANRRYTDLFEWGQRSVPLSLGAEIQHRLLPGAYTCEAGQFTLAAWLEPAGEVAGDTFDFSLDRDTLSLSMTDAMGHSVNAALLATLFVGSVRNSRRAGADLAEQARLADRALDEHAGRAQFVTGQLVRVDLRSGTAELVNAGHPLPLRLRDGVVEEVPLQADPPFGALPGSTFRKQELELRPGDRLMFVTDGVLDRQASSVDVRGVLASSSADHPREAVQALIQAAVRASGGSLEDDATALCFDWHGGPPRDRDASSGADV